MNVPGEDKRKSISLSVSLLVHGVLLLLFFFIIAWREPDPPIPEYGIELSFGMSVKGKSASPKKVSAPAPKDNTDVNQEESQESEISEETEEVEETINQEIAQTETETQELESPDLVEEEFIESSNESAETVESSSDPTPVADEKEKNNTNNNGAANDGQKETDSPEANNEKEESGGNDEAETIDERALYGKKEGTSNQGSFLNLVGWSWDSKPRPNDTSSENGKIIFQISIDDRGDIIGIKTIESTVTPLVEKIYKDEVRKLTFSPTSDNFSPATVSKGEITFIIKSR